MFRDEIKKKKPQKKHTLYDCICIEFWTVQSAHGGWKQITDCASTAPQRGGRNNEASALSQLCWRFVKEPHSSRLKSLLKPNRHSVSTALPQDVSALAWSILCTCAQCCRTYTPTHSLTTWFSRTCAERVTLWNTKKPRFQNSTSDTQNFMGLTYFSVPLALVWNERYFSSSECLWEKEASVKSKVLQREKLNNSNK